MQMSNRTAKSASAIVAGLLASAPLAMVSHSAAAECLSAPGDQTPDGSHWYYRIEHPSERHCWYLRREDGKPAQLASPAAPPVAKQVSSEAAPPIQRSVADARAELPQTGSATIGQPVPATTFGNIPRADAGIANPQASVPGSVIASRWPGQDATLPVSPQPVAPSPQLVAASPQPVAASPAASEPLPAKPAAAPRAVAAVPLAAADSSSKNQFGSIPMLLTVAMGALSLACVMGGAILGSVRRRRKSEREAQGHRRVDWSSHEANELVQAAYATTRMPVDNIPREPQMADDPDHRFTTMLARRRAAA
jgi:hypothetical protein